MSGAADGSIPERDEKMYAHNNNTHKAAHNESSTMCGPNYSTSATETEDHAMVPNPTSKKAKRRNGPIAVSSFVDQAFSLNLPGNNIRLVSVPSENSARLGNSADLDDDDYEEEDDEDVKGPFSK